MYTVHLAYELRDTTFKVNAVCPGYTSTDFTSHNGGNVEVARNNCGTFERKPVPAVLCMRRITGSLLYRMVLFEHFFVSSSYTLLNIFPMNESVKEFHDARSIPIVDDGYTNAYGVFALEQSGFSSEKPAKYCRRDFYKIALIRGENRCHYANKSIQLSGSTLIFFSPNVPYTWEPLTDETGYFTIFKESFYAEGFRKDIKQLPMFAPDCKPAYKLSSEMDNRISMVFEKMLNEQEKSSPYYYDLARTYVNELIYFALNMQPAETLFRHSNAKTRLTKIFLELVDREFSRAYGDTSVPLRSAKEYASHLNVHINYLNEAVKQTTGRTTMKHIADRISIEAQTLLKTTQLNISEIGYRLGFQEPAHFFNFFKKSHEVSPSDYRKKFGSEILPIKN